jgi:two-component system, chemotaxis family, protein-glutamate methylesterase/glutaminase
MAQDAVNKLVVIGGSAGSLEVILKLISYAPPTAVYVIIIHRKNDGESIFANLLSSRTSMPVKEVEDKEPILTGQVYVAPPDYHLLFEDKYNFSLDSSEKVHHSRPSIDVTFESAADTFGNDVIGILLSGANADGAQGLVCIRQAGGYAIVQDPASAEIDFMPQQAINRQAFDKIIEGENIGNFLAQLLNKS